VWLLIFHYRLSPETFGYTLVYNIYFVAHFEVPSCVMDIDDKYRDISRQRLNFEANFIVHAGAFWGNGTKRKVKGPVALGTQTCNMNSATFYGRPAGCGIYFQDSVFEWLETTVETLILQWNSCLCVVNSWMILSKKTITKDMQSTFWT